jgi:hypothetical protein
LGILASVGKAISKDPEVTARYQHIQTAQKALKNMLEEFFDQLASAIRYPVEENTAQLRKISIDEVLSPLIEEYRMLADVKELQIRYVPSNLTVLSNKELLSKIIRNGLDNAIKYTPKGGVVETVWFAFRLRTRVQVLRTTRWQLTTKAGDMVPTLFGISANRYLQKPNAETDITTDNWLVQFLRSSCQEKAKHHITGNYPTPGCKQYLKRK